MREPAQETLKPAGRYRRDRDHVDGNRLRRDHVAALGRRAHGRARRDVERPSALDGVRRRSFDAPLLQADRVNDADRRRGSGRLDEVDRPAVPSDVGAVSRRESRPDRVREPTADRLLTGVARSRECALAICRERERCRVLIETRPAAVLAGRGPAGDSLSATATAAPPSCPAVSPPTFFALSATSARFASGTAAVTTAPAVPPSATNSATIATTNAGLGRFIRRFIEPPFHAPASGRHVVV